MDTGSLHIIISRLLVSAQCHQQLHCRLVQRRHSTDSLRLLGSAELHQRLQCLRLPVGCRLPCTAPAAHATMNAHHLKIHDASFSIAVAHPIASSSSDLLSAEVPWRLHRSIQLRGYISSTVRLEGRWESLTPRTTGMHELVQGSYSLCYFSTV